MKTCQKPYKFDLEGKVQGRIWITNVNDTSSYGDTPMCKIWQANVKPKKSYGPDTKTRQKPYKFYLEVKVQGRIWIMNVRDTTSHGDTPMCQCQTIKKLWAGHESAQTDRQTDGQTDRVSDS